LVRPQLERLVGLLGAIPGLQTIALSTNGTLLAPLAATLRDAGLGSVNVSLDSLDPIRYAELTRGGRLADALGGIDAALAVGLPVKINMVALPDTPPADTAAIAAYAAERGIAVQRIRPYRLDQAKTDSLPSLRPAAVTATPLYDRPPPCALCNRIRLLADGTLRPCLHSDAGIKADPANPLPGLLACIAAKPAAGGRCAVHDVHAIGG
jgi:cyclic pyranopterin phosphate synthase